MTGPPNTLTLLTERLFCPVQRVFRQYCQRRWCPGTSRPRPRSTPPRRVPCVLAVVDRVEAVTAAAKEVASGS